MAQEWQQQLIELVGPLQRRQVAGVGQHLAARDADLRGQLAQHGWRGQPVLRCDGRAVAGFLADRRAGRVGGTTAVFGAGTARRSDGG